MTDVWHKLNLKDQTAILVANEPESFKVHLDALSGVMVHTTWSQAKQVDFVIAFVTKLKEVERHAEMIAKKTEGDATIWFAYPKQISKKYQCEFNRDTGWNAATDIGLAGVRQIAIDDDWSALRFRRTEFITSPKRR